METELRREQQFTDDMEKAVIHTSAYNHADVQKDTTLLTEKTEQSKVGTERKNKTVNPDPLFTSNSRFPLLSYPSLTESEPLMEGTVEKTPLSSPQENPYDTSQWFREDFVKPLSQADTTKQSTTARRNKNRKTKDTAFSNKTRLTPHEERMVTLAVTAKNLKSLANHLSLSHQTVKNQFSIIYKKLGVHSLLDAILVAEKEGIIHPSHHFRTFDFTLFQYINKLDKDILDAMLSHNGQMLSTHAIAEAVGKCNLTVKNHISSLRSTLGTKNLRKIALLYRQYASQGDVQTGTLSSHADSKKSRRIR